MTTKGDNFGVVAITEVPAGARSCPFDLTCVREKLVTQDFKLPVQVGVRKSGEIAAVSHELPITFWPKLVAIAPDCHTQNVRVSRWHNDTLVLQATRSIAAGQPLYLWFGEDLLVNELGIPPYLSPGNIRGGNCYICIKCGKDFEAPNYLKIHLASNCGAVSLDGLWHRLEKSLRHPARFLGLGLLAPPPIPASSVLRAPCHLRPQMIPHNQSPPLMPTHQIRTLPSELSVGHMRSDQGDQQAHLESIVSNMGKAKNGHVCLYCGKLYSRKYGLKIHIRTHTGYKPLQCRICQRPFGDPSNLNKHVRLHSDGNTPYRCDYCGKILVRRRDLERHIRSRHNDHGHSGSRHLSNETITSSGLNL